MYFVLVNSACEEARLLFEDVRAGYLKLSSIIPEKQYYRYNDHWRFVTQKLCFLAALIVFLEAGFLIARDTAADILGGV